MVLLGEEVLAQPARHAGHALDLSAAQAGRAQCGSELIIEAPPELITYSRKLAGRIAQTAGG